MDKFVSSSIWVLGLYFLPSIIAVARKTRNYGSVVVVNLFLGWTIIGWIIALAMAVKSSQPSSPTQSQSGVTHGTLPPPVQNASQSSDAFLTGARLLGRLTGRLGQLIKWPSRQSESTSTEKPIYKKWWAWVVIGTVLFYLVMPKANSNSEKSSNSSDQTTTSTIPTTPWAEILTTGVVAADLSKSLCPDLEAFIRAQSQVIADRLAQTEKPMNDAFESADYLAKIDWETFEHKDDVTQQLLGKTTPALSTNSSIEPVDNQTKSFLNDTLATCELATLAQDLTNAAIKLDTRLQSMQVKAKNLPWYPKDFSTYSEEIAYRWLNPSEFNCSYGDRCWGMLIIAKNGCPSSLYAEITILDSGGSNIGFTNDTTSGLSSGQQAKLIFEDFTPGANTARLSEISCY